MEIERKDILDETKTTHVTGAGKLILTRKYLVFRPHKADLSFTEIYIKLKDIAKVKKKDRLLGLAKLITITSKQGGSEYFVVWGGDTFVNAVKKAAKIK